MSNTNKIRTPIPGDVFSVQLPDGRYGAVRVLKQVDKSFLIAVTPYIDRTLPDITDGQLRSILRQNRFKFNDEPALGWYEGKPPKTFIFVGSIPVEEQETHIESNTYYGKWDGSCGKQVFMEWRWQHDRLEYENEVQAKQVKFEENLRSKINKPNKLMPEDEFWRYISQLHLGSDEEHAIEDLVAHLAKTSAGVIKQFHEALAYKLYLLDTREHAKNIGDFSYSMASNYVSSDDFLYARCAAVAYGKTCYERALADPKQMPKNESFEMLLYVAPQAYEKRTGRDFDYVTGCAYESFSNRAGWQ